MKRIEEGVRFGKLIVVCCVGTRGTHKQYKCVCDCGKETIVDSGNLTSGHTKTCGCSREHANDKFITTKQYQNTRCYHVWCGMKQRCNNPLCKPYPLYGGRGITVCEEWMNDFMKFYQWSITNGYNENLTLDRRDNNKGYSPDNCRWTTTKVQGRNTRLTIYIEHDGIRKPLRDWCEELGISYSAAFERYSLCQPDYNVLFGNGWHKALITFNEEQEQRIAEEYLSGLSLQKVAKRWGVSDMGIRGTLKRQKVKTRGKNGKDKTDCTLIMDATLGKVEK